MKYIHFFFCLLLGMAVQAQIKIGDNPQNIDPSSVLELESSSRVLVITRVNTAQMNAITPAAGAMVYNTDVQCIHYYTGTEWKDICDAVAGSITFTSEDGTVVITSTGGNNYDLKVGQITGMNIVNETVFGADIATATIGERQLAPNSVGASELQDNTVGKDEIQEAAVGTLEIIDGTIQPSDMQPGAFDQLLTTDAGGNVVWLNKNELGATQADQTTITGAGTATDPIKVADTVIGDILANANDITANNTLINNHIAADGDLDDQNEFQDLEDVLTRGNSANGAVISNLADPLAAQDAATRNYVDQLAGAASALNDGNIFVGSIGNVATGVAMSGDATINNAGVVTIGDLRITSPKIALNAVGQPHLADNAVISSKILNGNVTPIKIQPGAANQIMTTNTLGVVTWQPISAVGGNQDLASVLGFGTSAGNNQINDLANPTDPQDAATRAYVDAQVGGSAQTIVSANAPNSITAGTDGGAYYNDLDSDPLNEIELPAGGNAGQVLSTDGSGVYTWIDDNGGTDTDNQQLTLEAGNLLTLENDATPIDLTAFLDNTDNQQLTLEAGNLLTLENDATPIDLTVFLDNTDAQNATAVPVAATPANYATGAPNVEAHLAGIDLAIGAVGGNQDLTSVLGNGNSAGNLQITDLVDPTLNQDAATKKYVDDSVVAAGGGVPTDELNFTFEVNAGNLEITDNGGTLQVPLTDIDTDTNTTNSSLTQNGTDLILTDSDGATVTIPLTDINSDTNTTNISLSVDATNLILTDSDANTVTVPLASVADGNTTNTSLSVDATNLILTDSDTNTVTVPLASIDTDTNTTNTSLTVDATNLILTDSDANTVTVPLASVADGNTTNTGLSVDATNLILTDSDTNTVTVPLASVADGNTTNTSLSVDATNLILTDSDANTVTVPLASINSGTDTNTTNTSLTVDATNLILTDSDANTVTVPLASVADGNTTNTSLSVDATNLILTDSDANTVTVPLASVADGNTTNTGLSVDATNLILTDSDANTVTVPLASINSGTDTNTTNTSLTVDATNLILTDSDANTVTVPLASVADGNTTNTGLSVDATNLILTDSDANTVTVPLASVADGNTTNTGLSVDATNLILTDSDTNTVTIPLASVADGNTTNTSLTVDATNLILTDSDANTVTVPLASIADGNTTYSAGDGINISGANVISFDTSSLGAGSIPGTIVNPNFGNQNITTSGNLNITGTGTVTVQGTTVHPDYVFQKYFLGNSVLKESYDFKTLAQIEAFVKKYHHLPGIQSSAEIKAQGFWDLGQASKLNLEKIEELFLHTIEQEKKIDQLKYENQSLSAELQSLRKDMEEIKALLKNKD